ncbi:MAG: molybdopterin-dependent oxidoreductase [Saprospiraceae bacterium]|nr:molybdopterin-dependent oxidoreductase [Saprospiraceae bacterium]
MKIPIKKSKNISRRDFVQTGIQGTTLLGISPIAVPFKTFSPDKKTRTVYGACYHDCPDTCSWKITLEENKITHFAASTSNPYTAGKLCNKMNNFPKDVTFHPDRILTPLKRTGNKGEGTFEKVSWEEALRDIGNHLRKTLAESGGTAILPFGYAGTEGLVQNDAMSGRFFARLGASKLGRTICGDTAYAGVASVNGNALGVLPEDLVHSRYIILWGTNPVLTTPHLVPYIQKAKDRGAKIVLIDPYRSASVDLADWHIQPRPGTDVVLALSMMHVLFQEDLVDQDYITRYTYGAEQLRKHVEKVSPEYAEVITGISSADIVRLTREYAQTKPSAIRALIGMEKSANGASIFRAITMLPSLTGAWRMLGGGLSHFTFELFDDALNWERLTVSNDIGSADRRTINMVEIGKALTNKSLDPKIEVLFIYNSNPAVIAPNQNLVTEGLKREDLFTVVIEHFLTDTARYADYIFPATTQLEHWDLMVSWGQCYINLNQPAITPLGEAKPNSEFFRLLAKEMSFEEDYFAESDLKIIEKTLDSKHAYLKGITFKYLEKHGWARLKLPTPWLPFANGNFKTDSGKCEFYSESLLKEGKPPMPEYQVPNKSNGDQSRFPLQLLSIKSTAHFLNTSHANVEHLRKSEGALKVEISVDDARVRHLDNGDKVKVFNQRGEIIARTFISENIKDGMVIIPQGYWSSLVEGGSTANALTNDKLSDMGGGSALQDTWVQVEKIT